MALFETPKWVIYEGVDKLKYGEKKKKIHPFESGNLFQADAAKF